MILRYLARRQYRPRLLSDAAPRQAALVLMALAAAYFTVSTIGWFALGGLVIAGCWTFIFINQEPKE